MTVNLPIEVLYILQTLQKNDYDAFLVGGAVRDIFLNSLNEEKVFITDFDFTTNATPEQIQEVFPENFYENKFGTVSITVEHLLEQITKEGFQLHKDTLSDLVQKEFEDSGQRIIDLADASKIHESLESEGVDPNPESKEVEIELKLPPFEITTYRADGEYEDFRRPNEVSWGKNIEDDLKRRDFTLNAMALSVNKDFLENLFSNNINMLPSDISLSEENTKLVDPHNGILDITRQSITTVGEPNQRFQEDALRLLRAIRFAVQLEMEIDEATWIAISKNAHLIAKISGERIRDELLKMLKSNHPARAIKMLDKTGLLEFILPELLLGKGVDQAGHHTTDVWVHSVDALASCPSPDPIVRLATLLHDVGKPATAKIINGEVTFYNHEIIGSRIASKIGKRLRLSKTNLQRLFTLVRYHMFYYQPHHSDASIRRFMRKVGLENIDDILALREGDRLGSGARKTSWRLEEMKDRMIEQLHQPMEVKDLAINGNDLMNELKMKPGREMGMVLNELFEKVLEKPELNEKEVLLEMAREILKK